jgi:alpha-D-ribose 1-methylphosphonate 5-triphosphate synthase subunit PhnI
VFDAPANLTVDPTNVVWDIKLSSLTNYRMLFSKAGNRKLAASYMARAHTVNFAAENSALTMHLKELSVAAEEYTQTQVNQAQTVGLDLYTTIKLTPAILTSGANNFTDERYNLIAYVDFLQIDMYNLLKQTSTKIPQTTRGVNQLIDQAEKTTLQFVRAGVFAPGTWSSPDTFGDLETFRRGISNNGFYWLAGSLAAQAQNSREARQSPVLQGAVKLAGAIHSVDIIVNVNR